MTDTDARPRFTPADRVYGGIAAAAILLALWFLVAGGPEDGAGPAGPPRITLIDPRPGAELTQPVTVTFDARTPLTPGGTDTTATRHVHVDAGGAMLMPGPSDIRPVRGTTYRWTLPSLPTGTVWLRTYWSDSGHRAIPGPSMDSVQVTIR